MRTDREEEERHTDKTNDGDPGQNNLLIFSDDCLSSSLTHLIVDFFRPQNPLPTRYFLCSFLILIFGRTLPVESDGGRFVSDFLPTITRLYTIGPFHSFTVHINITERD